jgi:hypothetical protein
VQAQCKEGHLILVFKKKNTKRIITVENENNDSLPTDKGKKHTDSSASEGTK